MSQAVANTKQFAATTKGADLKAALGGKSVPSSFTNVYDRGTGELNKNNPYRLREAKKRYKAGKGELDVEATKAKREKVAAQKFGRYFDDPNLRSRQFSDEAMTEAEGVVKDFKKGPYAEDAYNSDDAPSEPIKVKSERIS
jgi:hypothetical protein